MLRAARTKRLEKDRKRAEQKGERRGKRELRHDPGPGCTHRGRWAIGPCSTPPSFVLTPAAFPPVRFSPLAIPLAASPVVVQVWRKVALVVTFGHSVGLSFPVTIPAVIQASVSLPAPSVKRPVLHGAIAVAAAAEQHNTVNGRHFTSASETAFMHLVDKMRDEPLVPGLRAHTPPRACIASFLSVSSSPPVPVTTGGVGRRPPVPVSSSSVSVAVLIAAPTVSVCRRVPSIMRHLVGRWTLRGGKEQRVSRMIQTHLKRIIRQVGHFDLICLITPNYIRVVWCNSKSQPPKHWSMLMGNRSFKSVSQALERVWNRP